MKLTAAKTQTPTPPYSAESTRYPGSGAGRTRRLGFDPRQLEPGMKIMDGKYGLRPLPYANFTLIWSVRGKTPAALEFGKLIVSMSKSPARAVQAGQTKA